MADAVREALSDPPGAGGHDQPWRQTGALHDSVGASPKRQSRLRLKRTACRPRSAAATLRNRLGDLRVAAAPQEMGTRNMPPRPFLAPVAAGSPKREAFAAEGEDVARAIGAEVAAALRGGSGSDNAGDATPGVIQASATMPGAGAALLGLGAAAALGWALSRPSSAPNLPGPTRAPPLMNQPSSDGDESGSPEEGADPVKPAFKPNDAHNPRNNNHNPNKDPEPPDSEEVYKDAQRDPKLERHVWYGKNAKGEWYQYREDGTGNAHFAGTVKRERVPITIRRSRK